MDIDPAHKHHLNGYSSRKDKNELFEAILEDSGGFGKFQVQSRKLFFFGNISTILVLIKDHDHGTWSVCQLLLCFQPPRANLPQSEAGFCMCSN